MLTSMETKKRKKDVVGAAMLCADIYFGFAQRISQTVEQGKSAVQNSLVALLPRHCELTQAMMTTAMHQLVRAHDPDVFERRGGKVWPLWLVLLLYV